MQNGVGGGSERYPVPQGEPGELIRADGYHYPDYPATYYGGAAEPPEGTDWVRIGKLLWQRKWWIALAIVLGTAGGVLASQWITPVYEASTTIWIENADPRSGPIRSDNPLAGEGFADVFRSRAVLQPVVEDRQLYLEWLDQDDFPPNVLAEFSVSEMVPGVYALAVTSGGKWTLRRGADQVVQSGRVGEVIGEPAGFRWLPPASILKSGAEIRFRASTPQQAALRLRNALQVSFNPRSQVLHASLTRPDAAESADVLNALADQFLTTATNLKAQKIREEVEMLLEQTEFTRQRLEAAEMALETHRIRTITLPTEPMASPIPGGQTLPRGQAGRDPVFDAFFEKKLRVESLEADRRQLNQVKAGIGAGNPPNTLALQLIPSAQSSVELTQAIAQLQELQLERQTLLTALTEEHPQIVELTRQIRGLQQATIPVILEGITDQIESQLALLSDQVDAQTTELRQIPTRTIEGARRQREVTMAEQLHNMLLVRLKEAQLAEATSGPGIQIIDPAMPPNFPVSNSGPRVILMISVASLGIGIAGVLLHDQLDKRIRYPDQVTTGLGLPVLGVVPRLGKGSDRGAAAAVAIESFRGLRTQIAHADGRLEGVQLITSPSPGEGKSLVSANLAISYATAGHSTVLVDCDTRRGRAQEMFDLPRAPGLTDYLMGSATLDQVMQSTKVDNLTLIARGRSRGFNADLLDGKEIEVLIEELRESFEVVLIDAPPLAAGADVLMLGKRSDKVVIVLRAGSTHEDLARTKLQGLGNVHLPIVGAVLNSMPKSTPYYDRYVHYYYADAEVST